MEENKNNRLWSLDLIKFIASFFVIFIHCTFSRDLGMSIKAIARFAVPFFFICSGYFLDGNTPEKILTKTYNIFKLLLLASGTFFCFTILTQYIEFGKSGIIDFFSEKFNFTGVLKFIFFNVPFTSNHLWYLLTLIYVYLIYYFIVKYSVSDKFVFISAAALIFIHLISWQLCLSFDITDETFILRNFLFFGYPFITLGVFIKRYQHKLPKINTLSFVLLLCLGSVMCVLSRKYLGLKSLPAGAIVIALTLFIYVLNSAPKKFPKQLKSVGTYSTYIYIFHPIFTNTLRITAGKLGVDLNSAIWKNSRPILVGILTLFFVIAYCKAQKHINQRLLNKKTV